MSLPRKIKDALKSSPSTKPLVKYLEGMENRVSSNEAILSNAVDNDTIYDDTEIQNKVSALEGVVGDSNTDNTLVKDVANLKITKANSNHSHSYNDLTDKPDLSSVSGGFTPYHIQVYTTDSVDNLVLNTIVGASTNNVTSLPHEGEDEIFIPYRVSVAENEEEYDIDLYFIDLPAGNIFIYGECSDECQLACDEIEIVSGTYDYLSGNQGYIQQP